MRRINSDQRLRRPPTTSPQGQGRGSVHRVSNLLRAGATPSWGCHCLLRSSLAHRWQELVRLPNSCTAEEHLC